MITHTVIFYSLLAAIWCFFVWLHHDYRLDVLRYRLFLIRDKLFAYAEDGKISFDDPAYILTRTIINGSLRFAHRLTLTDLLVAAWVHKKHDKSAHIQYETHFLKCMKSLNFNQKKKISALHDEMHFVMLAHLGLTSPLLFPFAFLIKMAFNFHLLNERRMLKKAKKGLKPLDTTIYDLGNQTVVA
ncbi:hypothetical protein [Methylomonas rhizoryzae]|uniref:hypothetical protein n=1 Tax=Methylomonas rhizoryzae TaxID=2608981 RepID=UPI001232DE2A|nr:hypothetical protein [Methylomonas rhizoryzae]